MVRRNATPEPAEPIEDPEEDDEEEEYEGNEDQVNQERPGWSPTETDTGDIPVETGRGNVVKVAAGSPFAETIEKIADDASYGGYFRVYLNGEEIVNPEDSPPTIEQGMRIALTSYDKVG